MHVEVYEEQYSETQEENQEFQSTSKSTINWRKPGKHRYTTSPEESGAEESRN
jgi:hypothetical protein